ncbi:TPA: ATP-binding cassette domain-containing protein, partial [Escherichia coli]|nr:ATP-binding cassette domain-containing protein [Escherichia coli]
MSKHSDSHDAVNAFQACLSFLPSSSTERILKQLKQSIDYEPVIGIMGKTGAGKSSLCNALFQEQTCLTSEL